MAEYKLMGVSPMMYLTDDRMDNKSVAGRYLGRWRSLRLPCLPAKLPAELHREFNNNILKINADFRLFWGFSANKNRRRESSYPEVANRVHRAPCLK
jgi:hypothetical protein